MRLDGLPDGGITLKSLCPCHQAQPVSLQEATIHYLGRVEAPCRVLCARLNHPCRRSSAHAYRGKTGWIDAVPHQRRADIRGRLEVRNPLNIVTAGLHIEIGIVVLHGVCNCCHDGHRENDQAEHDDAQASAEAMVKWIS